MCMSTLWSLDQDDSPVFVTDDPPEHKLKSGPAFTGDSTLLFLTSITPLRANSQLTHTVAVLCGGRGFIMLCLYWLVLILPTLSGSSVSGGKWD